MTDTPSTDDRVVRWLREYSFNGDERGDAVYESEAECRRSAANDGGVCVALVRIDDVARIERELAAMTQDRDEWREAYANQRGIIEDEMRPKIEALTAARDALRAELAAPYTEESLRAKNGGYLPLHGGSSLVLTADHKALRADAERYRQRQEFPRDKVVRRIEDMSARGYLELIMEDDGDIIVSSCGMRDGLVRPAGAVQFCAGVAGGGRSPHTRITLITLMVAMERDNEERPIAEIDAAREGK